jgi:hypothetical protein
MRTVCTAVLRQSTLERNSNIVSSTDKIWRNGRPAMINDQRKISSAKIMIEAMIGEPKIKSLLLRVEILL